MAKRRSTAFSDALLAGAPLDLTLKDNDPELIEALGAEPVMPIRFVSICATGRWKPCPVMPKGAGGCRMRPPPFRRGCWACRRARGCSIFARRPGGKTAQLIKAGYAVTALDSDARRMERLKENLSRLDYSAETVTADAGHLCAGHAL